MKLTEKLFYIYFFNNLTSANNTKKLIIHSTGIVQKLGSEHILYFGTEWYFAFDMNLTFLLNFLLTCFL